MVASRGACPPSPQTRLLLVQELVEPMVQQHQLSLPVRAFPHQNWGGAGSSSLVLGCTPSTPPPAVGLSLPLPGWGSEWMKPV